MSINPDVPLPPIAQYAPVPSCMPKITFETFGSTLESCDTAAADIARGALGTDDFQMTCHGYEARYQTVLNEVLVWRGNYTARRGY